MSQSEFDLKDVLWALQDARIRATYGAVAPLVGEAAMFMMQGRPRDPLHSWVVNKRSGDPTKYKEDQKHPDLYENDQILTSPEQVRSILRD